LGATVDCVECRKLRDLSAVAENLYFRAFSSLSVAVQYESVDSETVARLKAIVLGLRAEREEATEEYQKHLLKHSKSMAAGSSGQQG
jgi:hypothetical protein